MLFTRVEKQGKYRESWTLRRIAFDTEKGMMYCTTKEANFRVTWKHQVKVIRIIAKASVIDMNFEAPNFDVRDLFSFKVEGSYRHLHASTIAQMNQPVEDGTVMRPIPSNPTSGKETDVSKGEMLAWYFRTDSQTEFMKVYTTVRDVLIKEGMRPPQFWGLPKVDPRIDVPLGEPPLYLWFRFRSVKHSVFYACVHGHLAVKGTDLSSPTGSVTLWDEPMYLTVFDNSVMVFRENRRVLMGIPTVDLMSLNYSTVDVKDSVHDPKNEKRRCFLALLSDQEKYPDLLFVPTLERFADANEENTPAAQVKRVCNALVKLDPVTHRAHWEAGEPDAPPLQATDVSELAVTHCEEMESSVNGLLDVYARAQNAQNPLHLPDVSHMTAKKGASNNILGKLPAPHRLSSLAKDLGIKMKKSITDYPDRNEYLMPEATVTDPTCREKPVNPLLDLFLFTGAY